MNLAGESWNTPQEDKQRTQFLSLHWGPEVVVAEVEEEYETVHLLKRYNIHIPTNKQQQDTAR